MKITKKEKPELFTKIGERIIERSSNEHRRGSTFYVKYIVEFKPKDKIYYPEIQNYEDYIGYWETNEFVESDEDVDWNDIEELTKVKKSSEMISIKKWIEI